VWALVGLTRQHWSIRIWIYWHLCMMILEHVDESDGFIKVSPIESMQKVMGGNLSRPRSHSGKMGHGKAT